MPLSPGSKVGDSYELVRQLDHGNMGELWVARQADVRDVAIKFILGARPELRARFEAEIKAIARLNSNYVVRVFAWGEFESMPYMVMELLSGHNLDSLLRKEGRLSADRAVDCLVQAAAGVASAHHLGIVHRDLKPANLFFDQASGVVKVLDFGIAGAGAEIRESLTHDGMYMGTPNYSAPEQFDDTKRVTPAADIWALGAILYELVSGNLAFPGVIPGVLVEVREREPPRLGNELGLRPELIAIVNRCLAKKPEARFQSAEALIEALAPFGTVTAHSVAASICAGRGLQLGNAPTELAPAKQPTPGTQTLEPMVQNVQASNYRFYNLDALVDALAAPRVIDNDSVRPVVFMLGAGVSLPAVPGVVEVVKALKSLLPDDQQSVFDVDLARSTNPYQDAFKFLGGRASLTDAANTVIRKAVLRAYNVSVNLPNGPKAEQDACGKAEKDQQNWRIPKGLEHLGTLIARGQREPGLARFSRVHLTTNFDPLLRIAVNMAGGTLRPVPLTDDLPITEAEDDDRPLYHLHGFWRYGQTKHIELDTPRPRLERSLQKLLGSSLLVVVGYGGWNDVFMKALDDAAADQDATEILWAFFERRERLEADPRSRALLERLAKHGGKVTFYENIDSNELFAKLASKLKLYSKPPEPVASPKPESDPPLTPALTLPPNVAKDALAGGSSTSRPPQLPVNSGGLYVALTAAAALAVGLVFWLSRGPDNPVVPVHPVEAPTAPSSASLPPIAPTVDPGPARPKDSTYALELTGDCQKIERLRIVQEPRIEIAVQDCLGKDFPRNLVGKKLDIVFDPGHRATQVTVQTKIAPGTEFKWVSINVPAPVGTPIRPPKIPPVPSATASGSAGAANLGAAGAVQSPPPAPCKSCKDCSENDIHCFVSCCK
ncbi:MAG TPA: protein kinase [Polyangiaceae bacterium]|nr:protein kinase [Polyangiaceae bacterium]